MPSGMGLLMPKWWGLCPLLAFGSPLWADYMKTDCLGPKGAKTRIVYLHGWDDPNMGSHERLNRKMWERLAQKHQWRIALPRGDGRCSNGRRQCWRVRSVSQLESSWRRVEQGAKQCFGKAEGFGVLGFSNGGYMVGGVFQQCIAPKADWYIAVGSGGLSYLPAKPKDPACGPLRIQIGQSDITRKRAKAFYNRLKPHTKDIKYQLFKGGHIIHEGFLIREVKLLEP